jgi:hypothetical protein
MQDSEDDIFRLLELTTVCQQIPWSRQTNLHELTFAFRRREEHRMSDGGRRTLALIVVDFGGEMRRAESPIGQKQKG